MTTSAYAAPTGRSRSAFWRPAALAAVVAAAGTTAVAAVAHTAGVSLAIEGEQIPLAGFTQLTLIFAAIGILFAAALRKWAGNPRTVFVRTTIALTALSLVPDLIVNAAADTKLTLMLTHLVAAAIVIPVLAARLAHQVSPE
ncbi:hypothetical protein ASD42_16815 [Nocardia sp. Root136]|uniref:DUF6069 family protein n=1 Tax=Nocardia sp. Root136 TaxID=1736458 RepID=UPI0006F62F7B|nr:DUF6069 family protein [Nocardia sp. Root136]KQY33494.1 hypothetical protein ASD42_16815 [Nocardia sp. Root136]